MLAEEDVNNKQSIHIFKCEDSVIKIGGKVNEILIGVGFNLFFFLYWDFDSPSFSLHHYFFSEKN